MRPWVFLPLITVATVVAQEPLSVGDRVRLTAPAYRLDARIGTVRSVSNDRMSFRPSDSTESVEVNYRGISSLERSVGTKPSIAQGLIYGGGAGLLAGGVIGAATCGGTAGPGSGCTGNRLTIGFGMGLAAGAILGFTVLRTDRWVRVVLPIAGRPLGFVTSVHF
jgi:hypothetical protein